MNDRRGRAITALVTVAGCALIASLVWAHMDLLADTFWYIAHGRFVLDGGHFPRIDPFSFSSVKTPFVVHMPGSVLLFAWLDRVLGLRSLLVVATAVESAALVLLWLGRRPKLEARLLLLPLVVFAVVLQEDDLCARGQVFGDLFFVALLLTLDRIAEGARWPLWVAPFIGAAWVNLHSSFLLGALVPVLYAGASLFDERPAEHPGAYRGRLVAFGGLIAIGSLANPYGPALIRNVMALASHPTTFQQKLFRSPDFHSIATMVTFAIAAAAMATRGASTRDRGRRVSDLLVLATFMGFAASGVRYLPHLLYVSIHSLAGSLGDPRFAFVRKRASVADGAEWPRWLAPFAIVSALAMAAESTALFKTPRDPYGNVPIDSANFVRDQHLEGNVLNEYHWGGFLLYAWMGAPKVFVDGRSYLYFNGVMEDSLALESLAPRARELLEVYAFRTAILERGGALAQAVESLPEWRRVHQDRLSVVLVHQ